MAFSNRSPSGRRSDSLTLIVGFGLVTIVLGTAGFIAGRSGTDFEKKTGGISHFSLKFGTTQVVVLKSELVPGQKITAQDLTTADWPTDSVPNEAVRVVEEAIGSYIKYAYPSDIPLRQKDLSPHALTEVLEPSPDQRGVSVTLDEKCAVEGFVTAGRYVDVIYTYWDPRGGGSGTKTLVENSRVLSLNKNPLPANNLKATETKTHTQTGIYTATLSATPEDVNKIILAQKDGQLCFSLRGTGALDAGTPGVILTEDLRGSNRAIPTAGPKDPRCNEKAFLKDRERTLLSECNGRSKELEEPF